MISSIKAWWQDLGKYPGINWQFSLIWLLAISFLGFLWHLGSTGLVDETEPLFAEAARQMTVTGDWITPYFNGETRFDKPPLVYWLMAIGYHLIGVNEWAVRLPSALAAIALMSLGFYTLRYFGFATPAAAKDYQSKRSQRQLWLSAWGGSAMIALNPQTLVWGRIGVSDMLLSGCMGMALFCFFWGYASKNEQRKQNKWYLAFYILLALAVLAKGPVGIVLPGLIILSFLLYVGKFQEVLQEINILTGGLVFLVITLPWYILVIFRNGESYINSFFGYHNVERFTAVVNGHSAPGYFYFLVVAIAFLPWSTFLPLAILRLRFWQRGFWCQQPRHSQLGLFAFFWFICIFLFFTVAVTKLPSYVLPLLPAAAVMVALLTSEQMTADRRQKEQQNLGFLLTGIFNFLILVALAIALIYLPKMIGYDPAVPNIAELFAESGLPLKGGTIWAITAIFVFLFLMKKLSWRWLGITNLIGFITFLILVIFPTSFLLDQLRQQPLRELSTMIKDINKPNEEIIMIGFKKPSVVFYSQKPVTFLRRNQEIIDYFETEKNKQSASDTFLLLTKSTNVKKIPQLPPIKISWTKGYYQLIRSQVLEINPEL